MFNHNYEMEKEILFNWFINCEEEEYWLIGLKNKIDYFIFQEIQSAFKPHKYSFWEPKTGERR